MPIVEYKFNVSEEGKNIIPGYIVDRGYHYRDSDKTFLGFVLAQFFLTSFEYLSIYGHNYQSF